MTDLQLRSLLKLAVVGAAASVALVGCGKKEEPPAAAAPARACAVGMVCCVCTCVGCRRMRVGTCSWAACGGMQLRITVCVCIKLHLAVRWLRHVRSSASVASGTPMVRSTDSSAAGLTRSYITANVRLRAELIVVGLSGEVEVVW
jgi:hypothetical protein